MSRDEYEAEVAFLRFASNANGSITVRASDGRPLFAHYVQPPMYPWQAARVVTLWRDAEPDEDTKRAEQKERERIVMGLSAEYAEHFPGATPEGTGPA